MGLLDYLRGIVGVRPLLDEVLPRRAPPRVPTFDGRTATLRALRDYVCALEFFRVGDTPSQAIPFRVLPANFHVDYPDVVQNLDFASGVVMCLPTGRFTYEPQGLSTFVNEESAGVHGRGTALQVMGTYVERFNLDYSCAIKQQRRAWKAGMEVAFSPVEGVAALRLRTRGYYDQTATFTLKDGALFDAPAEGRGRRRVQLGVELRVQVVRLRNFEALRPVLQVNTDVDAATGLPVSTSTNLPDGS